MLCARKKFSFLKIFQSFLNKIKNEENIMCPIYLYEIFMRFVCVREWNGKGMGKDFKIKIFN